MNSQSQDFQSSLADEIISYLSYKRALGRRFDTEEKALRLFDRYLFQKQILDISTTPDLLEAFFCSRPRTQPRSYNHLVGVVRRLFQWLVAQGRLSRLPTLPQFRKTTSQRIPFIFDIHQAQQLIETASHLPDNSLAPHRGMIYSMIFRILYGLGLRVGEVARLRRCDVDLCRRLLIIRQTKFSKTRLVPFGPHLTAQLEKYLQNRERQRGAFSSDSPVFSFRRNEPISPGTISQTFHRLVPRLHLHIPEGVTPPCVHCLRHSFAVNTLLRWYRSGGEPSQKLIFLSTFMGHVNPQSTAVYLTITADLFQEANQRFQRFAQSALTEV